MSVLHKLGRFLRVWWPAVLASLVIMMESTDTFSAQHTSSMLRPVVESLFGRMTEQAWGLLHHHIRKIGHFVGYGLVSLAYLRGWLQTPRRPQYLSRMRWWLRAAGLGVLSAACVAALDEWHQSFIPSRTGVPQDVLLDTCGAIVACALMMALVWWGTRRDDDFEALQD